MIKKVAKNASFLFLSQALARIIGFLYFIFLARVLGVYTFGIYTFVLSFVYNFIPVADFGLERFVLKEISRNPEESTFYVSRLIPVRLFLGVGVYLIIPLVALILGQPGQIVGLLLIFGLAVIPYNITFMLSAFHTAKEKMEYVSIATVALVLLTGLFGIMVIALKLNQILIFLAYPLANVLLLIFFFINFKSVSERFNLVFDFEFIKKVLMKSWVFAGLSIVAVFYLRSSIILLGLLKGPEATGLYGSVFKFIEAGILLPQAITLALFPVSSRLYIGDREKLKGIYLKGLILLFLISLPFAFLLFSFPKLIIKFSFGRDYLLASGSLSVLGLALILFFINALAGNVIQNSPRVKSFLPLLFTNFIVAVILCLWLIPKYSILGAAWAVVGGEIFGIAINNYFVFQEFKQK